MRRNEVDFLVGGIGLRPLRAIPSNDPASEVNSFEVRRHLVGLL